MSRILWINPLGTSVFDATIDAELNRVKRPTTEVEVRSLKRGPHHLEYHAYEAWVTPDVLTTVVAAEREGFDAAVIGCFYDTAVRVRAPYRDHARRLVLGHCRQAQMGARDARQRDPLRLPRTAGVIQGGRA